jgi:hypothetical protein
MKVTSPGKITRTADLLLLALSAPVLLIWIVIWIIVQVPFSVARRTIVR